MAQAVDAGLSNLGHVKGTVTEDNVPGEGIIYYDIRFTVYHRESEIKILVNIEAQKSTDSSKLGYHLENRIAAGTGLLAKGNKFISKEGHRTHTFEWLEFKRLKDEYFYPLFLKKDIFNLPNEFTIRTEIE